MRTQKSCIRTKEFLVAYIPDTKDVGVLRSPYKNTILSWLNPSFKEKKNKAQLRNYRKYRDRNLIKMRNFIANNKEHFRTYNKTYHEKNKEKIHERKRLYYEKNKECFKLKRNSINKTRYYNDINYYLTGKLRGRFKSALKARGVYKTSTALSLLGCSLDFFRVYIESKFTEGMTWENKGKFGWHIDHIKPLCSFNLLDIEQQKLAFHYTNLQPLWWRENLTKGRKSYAD